ncbi:hypothetical protein GLA29479_4601 [Lysobacter antibioticus]|uniref:Uncharacterized protein n=1 Tax=Lysobacter antibioticus TaxID=84531 RepID=A0A0S2FFA8_LYSAN|nr:hypothetical protein GLA29479_4601 [Lysobacter antibioticus]ALN82212.1 hypothetical protein LA76x_4096 [Lysobacter antibioticus]
MQLLATDHFRGRTAGLKHQGLSGRSVQKHLVPVRLGPKGHGQPDCAQPRITQAGYGKLGIVRPAIKRYRMFQVDDRCRVAGILLFPFHQGEQNAAATQG